MYKWLWLHPKVALFTKIGSRLVGVGSRLANPWSKGLTVAGVSAPRMVHLAICCWSLAGDSPSSLLLKCPYSTTACIPQWETQENRQKQPCPSGLESHMLSLPLHSVAHMDQDCGSGLHKGRNTRDHWVGYLEVWLLHNQFPKINNTHTGFASLVLPQLIWEI